MNNKGQTTVFISFLLCILLSLTLTAFEVIRLHTGKVKAVACVHSMRTGIMADYNGELFKRYHLLFIDTTYGTGSNGYLEEKIGDYLDVSLNGNEEMDQGIYQYSIEDICITNEVGILDEELKLLKNQIVEYEKDAGLMDFAGALFEDVENTADTVEIAASETEQNAREGNNTQNTEAASEKVEDPRDVLSNMLEGGILNLVMPGNTLSEDQFPLGNASDAYREERNAGFRDIGFLTGFLRNAGADHSFSGLKQETALLHYLLNHFSNGVNSYDDTVLKCELEYILEGRTSDKENMEAVVDDLIWLRMPINYTYLLSDTTKKEEAEVVAIGICVATGTPEFEKVVQYLLLGCWSYAEAIYDVKDLLSGEKVPFVKNEKAWKTDLKSLTCSQKTGEAEGFGYEEYLLLLFAKKYGIQMHDVYGRMLDVMEVNIQQENPEFQIKNCIGQLDIQGKIILAPLFSSGKKPEIYEYDLNETLSYCKKTED